jgi:hypothetical protein
MQEKENIENHPPPSVNETPLQEKQLNNPSTDESITSTAKTGTEAEQQQTEEMEVHHHTHAGHHKKTWKEYIWEFLMLFLAVFCGFLAEYQLEQTIERHREKEYIVTMIEDLGKDTTAINEHRIQRERRKVQMDSLSYLLSQPDYSEKTALIYYYARWTLRATYLNSTDRTLQQLKNAGGMRLITSKRAAEAIVDYDAQMKLVQNQNYSLEENRVTEFMKKVTTVFDGNVLDEMYGDSLIIIPQGNPPFITNDKQKFSELVSQLHFVKSLNNRNIYFENKLKAKAAETIAVLKKEYHLE